MRIDRVHMSDNTCVNQISLTGLTPLWHVTSEVKMADISVVTVALLLLLRLRRLQHQHAVNRRRRKRIRQRGDRRRFLDFLRLVEEEDRRLMIRQLCLRFVINA